VDDRAVTDGADVAKVDADQKRSISAHGACRASGSATSFHPCTTCHRNR
jgi:hypothetical protein